MNTDLPESRASRVPTLSASGGQGALLVRTQVEQDIRFFKARIMALKARATPNATALQTYQQILNRRLSVLHWLQDEARASGSTGNSHPHS